VYSTTGRSRPRGHDTTGSYRLLKITLDSSRPSLLARQMQYGNAVQVTYAWSRPLGLSGVCSWTSCSLVWSTDRWRSISRVCHAVLDTRYVCTSLVRSSWICPWNSTMSARRPISSSAEEICVVLGTCRQLPEDDHDFVLPRRNVLSATTTDAIQKFTCYIATL